MTCKDGSTCKAGECVADTVSVCATRKCDDSCKCKKGYKCDAVKLMCTDACAHRGAPKCELGTQCKLGQCVAGLSCDTIKCKEGYTCKAGKCAQDAACDVGFWLEDGKCADKCERTKCMAGYTCKTGKGCVADVACPVAGCKEGYTCTAGKCEEDADRKSVV